MQEQTYTVYIDGAVGTTGLQIGQRLAAQPGIEVLQLDEANRKELPARLKAVAKADVSILCLPDDAARELAAAAPADAKIIDASTAHRTLPSWAYGFAELKGRRSKIAGSSRVAVPGCYATGFLALAAPLVEAGALPASATLFCHAVSGYSGGGKQMIAGYEHLERPLEYDAPRQYALTLGHKHLPEMQAIAGLAAPPVFCPIVADYYSGMLVSLPLDIAQLNAGWQSGAKLAEYFADYYAGEKLITVHPAGAAPEDGMLAANTLSGRDTLEIFTLGNDRQLLLAARLDNLGKGAAGAAVQCMNLVLGREEVAGLKL
ncbi:MAG: N-acetyl-gamma-glutamyl-phosphate reductase [Ruminococcaceae bacterium]|nr:N-acetyl-gamma-glutamyl-phosphate reductase [Oscillospiraceae bacterium]